MKVLLQVTKELYSYPITVIKSGIDFARGSWDVDRFGSLRNEKRTDWKERINRNLYEKSVHYRSGVDIGPSIFCTPLYVVAGIFAQPIKSFGRIREAYKNK